MSFFLAVVLSIYGALHAYAFWRIRAAWPAMGWRALPLGLFFLLMIVGLVGVHRLEHAGYVRLARGVGLGVHCWVAIIFWLVCVLAVVQVWGLLARLAALAWAPAAGAVIAPRPALLGALVLVALAAGWSLMEARLVRPTELTLYTDALPAGHPGLLVAQVTDTHLGLDSGTYRLRRAMNILRRARPDVLVATGDVLDSPYADMRAMAAMLAEAAPPLGQYAIFGNHEFYSGAATSTQFLESAGFTILRHDAVDVGPYLWIAGIDDRAGRQPDLERELLAHQPADRRFRILLKHRPLVSEDSLGRFDLQLSGHTHGGQIYPWHYITRMQFRYVYGLHELGKGSRLFVSTGAGTWGPLMRLGAWPEVVLIRLLPLETAGATKPAIR